MADDLYVDVTMVSGSHQETWTVHIAKDESGQWQPTETGRLTLAEMISTFNFTRSREPIG